MLQISHAKTFKASFKASLFIFGPSLYVTALGASTIISSKDIDKYAFMCGSNFYETDVI